ncbi:hypothetical protein HKK55_08110 [Pseudomonas sp. ADAK18]|uniref:hypothetical protein n=1 Tax=Pseudomonas sp. ADAK18 TaxID=2730848 RepID=UPI0014649413|nr:hypothetical protein [Pseudomonas sp. ADAK18]QJI28681.1 hypothetical protein HKK55_08110 [Pseudomonas sp. ADAK18]
MKAFLQIVVVFSAAILTAACQSGPPPPPTTEVPVQKIVLDKWVQVRLCIVGSNTIDGKFINSKLCAQTQKYELFGGPVIKLAGQHGYVGSPSPQEAIKGFSAMDDGITYTLNCEQLPKVSAETGDSFHCVFNGNKRPLIKVDITYP